MSDALKGLVWSQLSKQHIRTITIANRILFNTLTVRAGKIDKNWKSQPCTRPRSSRPGWTLCKIEGIDWVFYNDVLSIHNFEGLETPNTAWRLQVTTRFILPHFTARWRWRIVFYQRSHDNHLMFRFWVLGGHITVHAEDMPNLLNMARNNFQANFRI